MGLHGIERRARRILGPGRRLFLVALDHGLPAGPLPGLEDPAVFLRRIADAPTTGVVANPGLVRRIYAELPTDCGLVVHLSAGTLLGTSPTSKVPSAGVAHAVRLGADAVSVQIHLGHAREDQTIVHAGQLARDAHRMSVPVLIMAYPPSVAGGGSIDVDASRHAARVAAELGADIVQTNYAGLPFGLREIVQGCPVPLVLAGGPKASSPAAYLEAVRVGLEAGASGISVGRNLFQHPDPGAFAAAIGAALFGSAPKIGMG